MTLQTVVFRADASIDIGTGHVMRCLTLAQALRKQGAQCLFICREHPGNLLWHIRKRGFEAVGLAMPTAVAGNITAADEALAHACWLGARWQDDAAATMGAVENRTFDWLIVDHYALDARWEAQLQPACKKLMVIDDLADRQHDCNLLLDQNPGRNVSEYAGRIRSDATLLLGSRYALLRPEFRAHRDESLRRQRRSTSIEQILVSMGGVDRDNSAIDVLHALQECDPPISSRVLVVAGQAAPGLDEIRSVAAGMSLRIDVESNVRNLAAEMAETDIAIGAAGGTAWERCCLGLPSIVIVLEENQRRIAETLVAAGAAEYCELTTGSETLRLAVERLMRDGSLRRKMSESAAQLIDGLGATRVAKIIMGAESR